MILSDRSIREAIAAGRILIEPFDEQSIQPSSVDLHLDHRFLVFQVLHSVHKKGVTLGGRQPASKHTQLIYSRNQSLCDRQTVFYGLGTGYVIGVVLSTVVDMIWFPTSDHRVHSR